MTSTKSSEKVSGPRAPLAEDEEDIYRQLTPKNNLQLITPTLLTGSGKDKNVEDGHVVGGLLGSVAELARAASKRSNRMQVWKELSREFNRF